MTRAYISELPKALESVEEIAARLRRGRPVIFLDFDGTLASITDNPSDTFIPPETREAVEHLRTVCPVAVVSGRDLDDVRHLVGVEGVHYAGSHGFDVVEADGDRHRRASEFKPDLDRAADELDRLLEAIPGAFLERKAFAPDVEWDKGKAVALLSGLVEAEEDPVPSVADADGREADRADDDGADGGAGAGQARSVVPLYIGDDLTDEDAFRAIADHGVGVVVRGEENDRETAASYVLGDPELVRDFLERLARWLEEG